ncbi:hypothetical protein DFJ77DRAFT_132878 [Powellomyces hirtus]|nr:hypothetical protein DFJ77DRAFT_132878 [Powellomyces hirtus]
MLNEITAPSDGVAVKQETGSFNFRSLMDCAASPVKPASPHQTEKRKRGNSSELEAGEVDQQLHPKKKNRTYQVNIRSYQHKCIPHWVHPETRYIGDLERRLTEEIHDFLAMMALTPEEVTFRGSIISNYRNMVENRKRSATLKCFGSLETGLALPTSDLDLVILDNDFPDEPTQKEMVQGMQPFKSVIMRNSAKSFYISKARVPIISCADRESGIPIDVSFNQWSGVASCASTAALMKELPALRPLVMVLKQFLHVRNLNSGGNGSAGGYPLTCWVAGFLKIHPDICAHQYTNQRNPNIGTYFLDFLATFMAGGKYNYRDWALNPGCFRGPAMLPKTGSGGKLEVIDPSPPHANVTAGFSKVEEVKSHLRAAYEELLAADREYLAGETNKSSMLGYILHVPAQVLESRPLYRSSMRLPANQPDSVFKEELKEWLAQKQTQIDPKAAQKQTQKDLKTAQKQTLKDLKAAQKQTQKDLKTAQKQTQKDLKKEAKARLPRDANMSKTEMRRRRRNADKSSSPSPSHARYFDKIKLEEANSRLATDAKVSKKATRRLQARKNTDFVDHGGNSNSTSSLKGGRHLDFDKG